MHPTFLSWTAEPLFGVLLTLAVYEGARWVSRWSRCPLVHPVFLAFLVLMLLLRWGGIPYSHYAAGGRIITFFLGPAVVAMAVPVYRHRQAIAAQWPGILMGVLAGSIVSVCAVCGLARLLGASHTTVVSMAPKSVTMAIALGISEKTGGIPAVTAIVVLFTGIFGGLFGLPILDWFGVRSRLARGLAMGTSAHGIGTARALEEDPLAGATAGLGLGLTGMTTALVLPLILRLLKL
jgi:predicted murein hydrolase (TIGR00659 family)